jgi:glycerophosphoryl diester phosphodiesterase
MKRGFSFLKFCCGLGLVGATTLIASEGGATRPVVIAHRGASGYLPEHTLESATMAYAFGADFIEQDVVFSKDDVLVVCHDITVDTTTDVATRFPGRARADGRFYAIDFTWAELRSLTVRERFDPKSGQPVFPGRFPANGGSFRLCTMEEAILLVQGLNRSTGKNVGIYPEIKNPAWHQKQGRDPGKALLELLAKHGYRTAADNVFVQCFEAPELQRLRREYHSQLKFVLLMGGAKLPSPAELKAIAGYAQAIGPSLELVATRGPDQGPLAVTSLVADAHAAGLLVHPYTLRADALPAGVTDFDAFVRIFVRDAGVDGFFTDQANRAIEALGRSR